MRHQWIILAGIIIWITGCYLDIKIIRYAYLLIITGTLVASIGAILWLKAKENRALLIETLRPKKDFIGMIRQAFDFRWKRVSILWTICAFMGILISHLSSVMMKNMGAYDSAVIAIKKDKQLIQRIGKVRDFTYMVTGHSQTGNGYSELFFGVIGEKESIKIKAVIEGQDGTFVPLEIVVLE